jgi:ATP-dependent HslUV protease subunit HslV
MVSNMFEGTTILCVRHNGHTVMAGDGQVSFGNTVLKHHAIKVRRLPDTNIVTGFAGSTADAFTLFERFEKKLKEYNNNLTRAAVELAKDWRIDKYLRRLEAMLIVADPNTTLMLSGTGDVVEPDHGVIAIGSGGNYALAAALAMVENAPNLSARQIAESAMKIASEICIYTNTSLHIEEL